MYHIKDFLLEMESAYGQWPLFWFAQNGREVTSVTFADFLADLVEHVETARKIPFERVAVAGYSSYEWIITVFALLLSGKVLIFMNPDLSDSDLVQLLRGTDAEYLMIPEELDADFADIKMKYQTGFLFHRTAFQTDVSEARARFSQISEEKSCFLCFTSGTTKSSKGVVIQTETLVKHTYILKEEQIFPGNPGERFFLCVPLYHIYALTYLFHVIANGACACFSSSNRWLVREIELLNPETVLLVPSMLDILFDQDRGLTALHTVITGGSSVRPEQADQVRRQGVNFINVYGSSEAAGVAMLSRPDSDEQWMMPLKCIRYGISESGELWLEIPYHMEGYYRKQEETAQVMEGDLLWTGDAACMDSCGRIKITGRIRDTIVMENGEKIHAEDLDHILSSMKGVKEAAVIYTVDSGMTAVIVPESGVSEEEIRREIEEYNKGAAPQFRFRKTWYREKELPRSSMGKIKRRQLEEECRKDFLLESNRW